jgi:hypothetical protein
MKFRVKNNQTLATLESGERAKRVNKSSLHSDGLLLNQTRHQGPDGGVVHGT